MEDIPKYYKDLLHKIATEQDFVNYDMDVQPISTGGANYTSKLYNVTLSEGKKVLHMFAKVAAIGEKMRARVPKVYETERYCYTKLIELYDKIQNDNHVPAEHRLTFCKCYGSHPKLFEETIVLEDLVTAGYKSFARLKSVDWPYASSAVEELAKMHAISFAHREYYPENFKKVKEEFYFDWKITDKDMQAHMDNVVTRACNLVSKNHKDKLAEFFKLGFDKPENFGADFKKSRWQVMTHSDFKPSNLMHKELADGKIDIKIVDLQTLQGGSPVTDLIYFIFTGSDEEFRAKYYDKLIDHYYTELSAAMKRLNLKPEETYSRSDFDFELKEKLPFGLTLAVFTLPVITVASQDAPVVNENLEIANFAVEKTSDLYAERLNGVVNDYVKWGILDQSIQQMEEEKRARV